MNPMSKRSLLLAAAVELVLLQTSFASTRYDFEGSLPQSEPPRGVYAHLDYAAGAVVIHSPGKASILVLVRDGRPTVECSVVGWGLDTVGRPKNGQKYSPASGDDQLRLQQLAKQLAKLVDVTGSDRFDKWIAATRATNDFVLAGFNSASRQGALVVGTGAPIPFAMADNVTAGKFAAGIALLPDQAQFAACGPSGWAVLDADRLTWILDRNFLPLEPLFPSSLRGRSGELIYSKQKLLAAAANSPEPLRESWTDERLVEALAGFHAKEVRQHPGLWSWIP